MLTATAWQWLHTNLTGVLLCRIGLVLMRSQEGNSLGVSNVGIMIVAWVLTVVFRPSACIPCLQASTHIVCKHLPPMRHCLSPALPLR